jgi:hypothetical protein
MAGSHEKIEQSMLFVIEIENNKFLIGFKKKPKAEHN